MRIANILPGGLTGYDPSPALNSPDVQFDVVEMAFEIFPVNGVDFLLTEVTVVDAVIRAAEMGFDAALINTATDYGLRAARSAVDIPVVGGGQAAMALAGQLGTRFSIVSIWPETVRHLHEGQLREYGLTDHCASMRFVTAPEELAELEQEDSFFTRMRSGEEEMISRIVREVDAAIHEDGCDTVVLGCGCMHPVAGAIAAAVPAPVIDPLDAGYLAAETMARMSLSHSPIAYRPIPSSRAEVMRGMAASAQATLESGDIEVEDCGAYCAISSTSGTNRDAEVAGASA
jgi:allantoin racemase